MSVTPLVRPNIIHWMVDDSLPGQYDPLWTPYTWSRPEGHWIEFDAAVSETPLCAPARAAILTGQTARRNGVRNNDDGASVKDAGINPVRMVQAALRQAGYYTALYGKYLNGYPWIPEGSELPGQDRRYVPAGWNDWRSSGGANFFGNRMMNNGVWSPYAPDTYHLTDLMSDYTVAGILGGSPQTGVQVMQAPEPFFMQVNHRAPHKPSTPALRHANLHPDYTFTRSANYLEDDNPDYPKPSWFSRKTPDYGPGTDTKNIAHFATKADAQARAAQIDAHRLDAMRCNKGLDEAFEAMITALKTRGVLNRTIILISGDNSNCFGEHRHNSKGVPYQESINPHLWVRYPGATARTSTALVSNIDFAPTWLDLAGGRPLISPQGMSFRGLLEGTRADADYRTDVLLQRGAEPGTVQFGPGTWDGIKSHDGWKYIQYAETGTDGEPQEELYDLNTDPVELYNLAAVPEHAEQKAYMRRKMLALLQANRFSPGD